MILGDRITSEVISPFEAEKFDELVRLRNSVSLVWLGSPLFIIIIFSFLYYTYYFIIHLLFYDKRFERNNMSRVFELLCSATHRRNHDYEKLSAAIHECEIGMLLTQAQWWTTALTHRRIHAHGKLSAAMRENPFTA